MSHPRRHNPDNQGSCVAGIIFDQLTNEQNLFGIDKLNIKRSLIPAITHVDYSARIQTVHKETNPKYHDLLLEFKKQVQH